MHILLMYEQGHGIAEIRNTWFQMQWWISNADEMKEPSFPNLGINQCLFQTPFQKPVNSIFIFYHNYNGLINESTI